MNSCKRRAIAFFPLAQLLVLSSLLAQNVPPVKHTIEAKLLLRDSWALQTSAKVEAKGEVISTPQFSPRGGHTVTVPTTVVAALVGNKTLPDPLFGMNLRDYPGVNYPMGANFSNIAMDAT